MNALTHLYRYREASSFNDIRQPHLILATSNANALEHPHFFEGQILAPRLVAQLLLTLQSVVSARYFIPANTLAKMIELADPVVTSGGGWLRFEGFSSCCSCYARVDLLPESYHGEIVSQGTTNVDFNAPMRAALTKIRDNVGLNFSVGKDSLKLSSGETEIIERKVDLPQRWLRGMVEVQSYLASMRCRFITNGSMLLRLLQTSPRIPTHKSPLWISPGLRGLITSVLPGEQAVRVTEMKRLRVLESILPLARQVSVFSDDAQQANAWVLDLGAHRFTLVLSAETWRGFSGEGQALIALMKHQMTDMQTNIANLRAQLHWQNLLEIEDLAKRLKLSTEIVDSGMRMLGASGLVGFDVLEGRYFHRVLPFDMSQYDDMHPRFANAKALLESGAVTLLKTTPFIVQVQSKEVLHQIREVNGEFHCTCSWYAKYQGLRGPCKHILAAEALRTSK